MNFYDVLAAKNWSGGIPTINFFDLLFAQSTGGGEQWQTYEGTLPATINANGDDMRQYKVWGNTGGVGDKTVQLFDKNNIKYPAYIRANGTVNSSSGAAGYAISDYIPVSAGDYVAHGLQTRGNLPHIAVYDENQELIRTVQIISNEDLHLTIESNEKFVRLSVRMAADEYLTAMFTRGAAAPETYVPYGYKLDMGVGSWSPYATHTGKFIDMTTGDENSLPQYSTAYFNNFFPNTAIITVKADTAGGGRTLRYMPYNENQAPMLDYKAEVQFIRDSRTVQLRVTIPSGAAYYGVSYHNGDTQKKISTTTPVYIGDDPLGEDEYVDYQAGKVYRMIDGTLTPTDPPVPLPALPTIEGTTIVDYAGQGAAPEKVYFEYQGGKQL